MPRNDLLRPPTNCFISRRFRPSPQALRGDETGPHSREDADAHGRTTRKEVPHGSVYRAPAPPPVLPTPTPARRPARTRPRHDPCRGPGPAGPLRGGGELEVRLLHPVVDLLGLLLAGPRPRPFLPRRLKADRRLARAPGSADRRRGDRAVLRPTSFRPPFL